MTVRTQAYLQGEYVDGVGNISYLDGLDVVDTMFHPSSHGISGAVVGTTEVQTLTNKTLTTPTIASLTNAQHNHTNAATGGLIYAVPYLYMAASDATAKETACADYVCDGTADEVQFNAMTAAIPATGGVAGMSSGRFVFAAMGTVTKYVTNLFGAGAGHWLGASQVSYGTRISPVAGFTDAWLIRVQEAPDTVPVFGAMFRDFTVDMNLIGTAGGILWRSNKGRLDHVKIFRAAGWGLKLEGYAFDIGDTKLNDVEIGECATGGAWFATESPDLQMSNCTFYSNGINCLIESGSQQFSNCHFYDADTNNIKVEGGASRSKFVNCKIEGAGEHGVWIDTSFGAVDDVTFIGCGILGNGDSAQNTYDNFNLECVGAGSTGGTIHITGGVIGGKSEADPDQIARYDLNLADSAAQNCTIVGLVFAADSLTGTAHVNDAGSHGITADLAGQTIHACGNLWRGMLTWDPGSLTVSASTSTTFTFTGVQTGVKIGDIVTVTCSLTQLGLMLYGYVSATNVVTVILFNPPNNTTQNLASSTFAIRVERG